MRPSQAPFRCALAIALATAAPSLGCVDTVHEDNVQALGSEQPGVPPGPLHRPGQPCITCHGGSGPASLQLSIGGTVYAVQGGNTPIAGVQVQIEDISGVFWNGTTNSAGNFYATLAQFAPHYPTTAQITSADGSLTQAMSTLINRDGSCADCHSNPRSPTSQGPVYLAQASTDGGTP
jgi:hypothetical protein